MHRFVTEETIREYIAPDQLLERFGGTDTWTFDYDTEKQLMIDQVGIAMATLYI